MPASKREKYFLIEQVLDWLRKNQINPSPQHTAAFVNSVCYLVTGRSEYPYGPSLREHLVKFSLNYPFEKSSLKTLFSPGDWYTCEAILHCAPLCFEAANNFSDTLVFLADTMECTDDDPRDLIFLAQRRLITRFPAEIN